MKVLFDSGASISLITKSGIKLLPKIKIRPTNVNVWAANNQRIPLTGEVMLKIHLRKPIIHRFVITHNNISGCTALLGTDIYPKLDSFYLAGLRNAGIVLSLNGDNFSLLCSKPTKQTYSISPLTQPAPSHFVVFKLLSEDFESFEEIHPISKLENGFIPDIPSSDSDKERIALFTNMLESIDFSHLSPPILHQIKTILLTHRSLFITTPSDPCGLIPNKVISITTEPGEPIRSKLRKYSPELASKIKMMNLSMLQRGIIEKSSSDWSNPVVLVQRPDSSTTLRLCLDLRILNKRISFDAYPIKDIKSILHTVSGYKIYSTLDISEAYFCLLIDPKDRHKLAFRTPDGLYQFTRLPFGILTGCAIWNRTFEEILEGLGPNVQSYFDDLVIFTNTLEEHLSYLSATLHTLSKAGLRIKLTKCQLVRTNVKFLGFSISSSGSSPTPDGVRSVQSLKRPETLKQLRSFLGSVGYYRDFIPQFTHIAIPLYDLTKKHTKFTWSDQANKSWISLKSSLSSDHVLIPPQLNKPYYLATDATRYTIAGVLLQKINDKLHPIEYFSRRLKPPETRYHTNEIEGLAIFACVKRWQHYLLFTNFTIFTDNSSMTHLFNRKDPINNRVARWLVFLASFRYTVIHIKGKDNLLPDLLSRYVDFDKLEAENKNYSLFTISRQPTKILQPTNLQCSNLSLSSIPTLTWTTLPPSTLRSKQEADPRWKRIIDYLIPRLDNIRQLPRPKIPCLSDFTLNNENILCIKTKTNSTLSLRPVVPDCYIPLALSYLHDSHLAAHPSPRQTQISGESKLYWTTLIKDTREYARSCIYCQQFKDITQYFPDVIGNNKITPNFPNESLSMDITFMQPSTNGMKYILSIMDMYSRFTTFYPLRNMYADTISDILNDHCCTFGFPNLIVTDDANNISASLQKDIFSLLSIKHSMTIPYRHNPLMVERIHHPLKQALSIMCQGAEKSWPTYLKKVTYALNTTYNGSLDCSPMQAFFMRQQNPQTNLGDITLNDTCDPDLIAEISQFRKTLAELSTLKKQEYNKLKNKNTKECPTLNIGDHVMCKRLAFKEGINRKMQSRRTGPWEVTTSQGSEISLKLISNPNITRRRHISHLAPFIPRPLNLQLTNSPRATPPITEPNDHSQHTIQTPPEDNPHHDNQRLPHLLTSPSLSPRDPQTSNHDILQIIPDSLIIIGIECHLRKALGLSKEIFKKFPQTSPYSGTIDLDKPNNEILFKLLRQRPCARRDPGSCILKLPKTRSPNPIVAHLTIQYLPGKAFDNDGIHKDYLLHNRMHINPHLSSLITSDTKEQRIHWFSQALDKLLSIISELKPRPDKLFIPSNIGCGYSGGNPPSYTTILRQFTANLQTLGCELFLIHK